MLIGNHDAGPQTTAEEDMAFLGLAPLTEDRAAPARPGHYIVEDEDELDEGKHKTKHSGYAGPEMDDDGRTDVPVRNEDEDDDEDDEDEDEDKEESAEFDGEHGLDEDDFALVEAILSLTEDEIDELDEDEIDLLHAVMETTLVDQACDALAEDEDVARVNAAYGVLDLFYEQINALQEGDEQPSYDELVGVIEAYEALAEETGLLTEKFRGAMKAKLKRGMRKKMRTGAGKRMKRLLGKAHKRGKFVVGGQIMTKSQKRKHLMKSLKGAKGKYAKSVREKLKGMRNAGKRNGMAYEHEGDDATSELVRNLSQLAQSVEESGQFASAANELIEGFSSLETVAKEYYERIAQEVSESEVDEDDGRVQMGRHLEGIARSAAARAAAIAEGDNRWSLDQYAEDLQAIAADLDDAMEAMKSID